MTTSSGLWKEGYGAVGATLKALEDAGVTLEHLKFIRSDEGVAKEIAELLINASKSRYADEEEPSRYTYPGNYVVTSLAKQIEVLAKLFGLDGAKALAYSDNLPNLPKGAEGWFAIPKWQAVDETYGKAVAKMLKLIGDNRTLKNWREGKLDAKYLRQLEKTEQMFAKFCKQQEGDIIIIPAQFGLRHRGRSVRRARIVFAGNEFGLGAFANGCMLLTHPEREQEMNQLHIDCTGDEYAPDGEGDFVLAPLFFWSHNILNFDTNYTNNAHELYGSPSGFVPQD